jgi:hypothetical protein
MTLTDSTTPEIAPGSESALPVNETTSRPSASADAAPDSFPAGFHYCQSGHRCGCDFGAASAGDTTTAHGGHPCGWNGWELNADLDHVAQSAPAVPLPSPDQPVPVATALQAAPSWEAQLEQTSAADKDADDIPI